MIFVLITQEHEKLTETVVRFVVDPMGCFPELQSNLRHLAQGLAEARR